MSRLEFFVAGTPAPQGSKRHVGNGRMVESSKLVAPWREDVRTAAEQQMTEQGWTRDIADQPLRVRVVFWLDRPASQPKTRRTLPMRKPDIDKLVRSTLDALTSAGALFDDARVVRLEAEKFYVPPPALREHWESDKPGAHITITHLTPPTLTTETEPTS